MKNDIKLLNCDQCRSTQQHYVCWKCMEYSLCLGCSNAGRNAQCKFCEGQEKLLPEPIIKIEVFNENDYEIPTFPKNNNRDRKISEYYKKRNRDDDED